MKEKKYILLEDDTRLLGSVKVYRVKYSEEFVKSALLDSLIGLESGCLGGYIESESNLSQEGNCCISADSFIYGKATVTDNAVINRYSFVQDNARISGRAEISQTFVSDNATIGDNVFISNSSIRENASISGNVDITGSIIKGKSRIFDNAHICNCKIFGSAKIFGNAFVKYTNVSGKSLVFGSASCLNTYSLGGHITGKSLVYEGATISGYSLIKDATIFGNTRINNLEVVGDIFYNASRCNKKGKAVGSINVKKSTYSIPEAISIYIKYNSYYKDELLILENKKTVKTPTSRIITLTINKTVVVINKTILDKKNGLIRYDIITNGKILKKFNITAKEENDTLFEKILKIVDDKFLNSFLRDEGIYSKD